MSSDFADFIEFVSIFFALVIPCNSQYTYPNMLAVYKQLRHEYLVAPHSVSYLVLVLGAHEDVSFVVLHQQVPEYFLHKHTPLVCSPDDAHGGGIHDDFPGVSLFVTLEKKKKYSCSKVNLRFDCLLTGK